MTVSGAASLPIRRPDHSLGPPQRPSLSVRWKRKRLPTACRDPGRPRRHRVKCDGADLPYSVFDKVWSSARRPRPDAANVDRRQRASVRRTRRWATTLVAQRQTDCVEVTVAP